MTWQLLTGWCIDLTGDGAQDAKGVIRLRNDEGHFRCRGARGKYAIDCGFPKLKYEYVGAVWGYPHFWIFSYDNMCILESWNHGSFESTWFRGAFGLALGFATNVVTATRARSLADKPNKLQVTHRIMTMVRERSIRNHPQCNKSLVLDLAMRLINMDPSPAWLCWTGGVPVQSSAMTISLQVGVGKGLNVKGKWGSSRRTWRMMIHDDLMPA